jgi:hypothetical protein
LQRKPFDYLVVPGFIRPGALATLNRDYPQIDGPGNMAAGDLDSGPAFAQLLTTLQGEAFAELVGEKFDVDLSGCTATIAVRRYCEATDGNIHTDHRSKVITLLLYFNPTWEHPQLAAGMLPGRVEIEQQGDDLGAVIGMDVAVGRLAIAPHRNGGGAAAQIDVKLLPDQLRKSFALQGRQQLREGRAAVQVARCHVAGTVDLRVVSIQGRERVWPDEPGHHQIVERLALQGLGMEGIEIEHRHRIGLRALGFDSHRVGRRHVSLLGLGALISEALTGSDALNR